MPFGRGRACAGLQERLKWRREAESEGSRPKLRLRQDATLESPFLLSKIAGRQQPGKSRFTIRLALSRLVHDLHFAIHACMMHQRCSRVLAYTGILATFASSPTPIAG